MDSETSFSGPAPAGALVERYLAGESDDALLTGIERHRVRAWIEADPARQAQAQALKQLAADAVTPADRPRVAALWNRLAERGRFAELDGVHAVRRVPGRAPRTSWQRDGGGVRGSVWSASTSVASRWVAGVATALVVGAAMVAAFRGDSTHSAPGITSRVASYSVPAGQRMTVTLTEGVEATLAPATSVRVRRDPARSDGIVIELTGAALFQVTHASARPVTVVAQGVTARVLGTEFMVRAYDASQVRVAVREGRVSVQSPSLTANRAVTLAARDIATVSSDGTPTVTREAQAQDDFAWAEGRLVLRAMPLGEALIELSRWYGLDFRSADQSRLSIRVDATFSERYDAERIRAFAEVVGMRAERDGRTVTFHRTAR